MLTDNNLFLLAAIVHSLPPFPHSKARERAHQASQQGISKSSIFGVFGISEGA